MAAKWWGGLDAATLRELASLAERATRPTPLDPARMAEELAAMLARGDRPTIGWFQRNYDYPAPPRFDVPLKPAAVARVAMHMVMEGLEPRFVARACYEAATAAGMNHDDAVNATAAGIARARKPSAHA